MASTQKSIYNSSSLSKDLGSQSVLNYPAFSPPTPYDIMTRYTLPQQNPFVSHAAFLYTHTHTHTRVLSVLCHMGFPPKTFMKLHSYSNLTDRDLRLGFVVHVTHNC